MHEYVIREKSVYQILNSDSIYMYISILKMHQQFYWKYVL